MTQIAINFTRENGTTTRVTARTGVSLMEVAVQAGFEEIEAKCFGNCCCVTCHVYIAEAWRDSFDDRSEMEESMLDFGENITDGSRLSCQIDLEPKHNGLVVNVPKTQRVIGL